MPYPIAITMGTHRSESHSAPDQEASGWIPSSYPLQGHTTNELFHTGSTFSEGQAGGHAFSTQALEGHSLSTLKHTLCWCLNYVMCLSIKKVSKRSPLNLWFRIPALFTLNDEKKCQFINREKPARDCILKHKFVHISFLRKLPSGLSAH